METILSALDDYSIVVRERLHVMLGASTVATKDGLQRVITKLLENLKKYPQDKRSLLTVFQKLGQTHPELTLPLVGQLLDLHPFLDTPEPDIEEPAYLCLLVLVFNAAEHCPTLEAMLDHHTKRHHNFLLDTYPTFMPERKQMASTTSARSVPGGRHGTAVFLEQTLSRVRSSDRLPLLNRIKLLTRAAGDLRRLGDIDPAVSDAAKFSQLYVECQALFAKTLATKFWTNPLLLSAQQAEAVETNIGRLFSICQQLQNRFVDLTRLLEQHLALLRIRILALQIVFLVRASNRSALSTAEQFLHQVRNIMLVFMSKHSRIVL